MVVNSGVSNANDISFTLQIILGHWKHILLWSASKRSAILKQTNPITNSDQGTFGVGFDCILGIIIVVSTEGKCSVDPMHFWLSSKERNNYCQRTAFEWVRLGCYFRTYWTKIQTECTPVNEKVKARWAIRDCFGVIITDLFQPLGCKQLHDVQLVKLARYERNTELYVWFRSRNCDREKWGMRADERTKVCRQIALLRKRRIQSTING